MARYALSYDTQRPFVTRMGRPFLLVFVIFYLCFHAVSGERGLLALFTESRRLDALNAELTEVKSRRAAIEHKVQRLSDNSLDLDLLDEQVRAVLGKAGRNEIIYFPQSPPNGGIR
ncbi:MAG: septum formation initiator family protein [Pseudomonadota bacterium]|nr:septum formation initiator family protein [Pseudomonadota bacterium]